MCTVDPKFLLFANGSAAKHKILGRQHVIFPFDGSEHSIDGSQDRNCIQAKVRSNIVCSS